MKVHLRDLIAILRRKGGIGKNVFQSHIFLIKLHKIFPKMYTVMTVHLFLRNILFNPRLSNSTTKPTQ